MLRRLIPVLLMVTVILFTGCTTKPAEETELKIGSLPRVFDLIAYVAQEEGLFEEQGISVEIVSFRSTVEMNSALLGGELDGIIQDVFEAVNLNKGETTAKLVGSAVMPRMFEIVAASDSSITSLPELRNKELALATSTIMEYATDRLLSANGLAGDDITKVNIPSLPLRLEALKLHRVSLYATTVFHRVRRTFPGKLSLPHCCMVAVR